MNRQAVAKELVAVAELLAYRDLPIRAYDLREGAMFVLPNGAEFVVGKKIKDEFGIAIELTDTRTKHKYVNGLENVVKFLRRQKAQLVTEDAELAFISKSIQGAFTDQPVPWSDETESELEKVQTDAEAKLGKELEVVKGRYYWEPGRSLMVNITLTGRPLFQSYSMGGLFGVRYGNGVLTVNPEWISQKESIPSYKWGYVVDKMIQLVKSSERIDQKIEKYLDEVEKKLGKKIEVGARRDIVNWCVKVAKGRLSVHSYPAPRGREFVIFPPDVGQPAVAHELVAVARELVAKDPAEVAHEFIMSYPGRLKLFRDSLGRLEESLDAAKRDEEGLVRAGAGMTEAQTLLADPLEKAKFLSRIADEMVQVMEKVQRGH